MPRPTRFPHAIKRLLPLVALLALTAGACTTWSAKPLPEGPEPVAGRVRVTRASGERLVLTGVQVHGDSLYGNRADVATHPRVAVAVANVARVEGAGVNASAPALLTLAALALIYRWILRPRLD